MNYNIEEEKRFIMVEVEKELITKTHVVRLSDKEVKYLDAALRFAREYSRLGRDYLRNDRLAQKLDLTLDELEDQCLGVINKLYQELPFGAILELKDRFGKITGGVA